MQIYHQYHPRGAAAMNKDHRYSDTDTTRGMLLFVVFALVFALLMGGLLWLITAL